jgi:hypothetical protein
MAVPYHLGTGEMIVTKHPFLLMFVVLLAAGTADAQHQHAGITQQLGSVRFEISCRSIVQETFGRGVSLLHSFWYEEAQKAFQTVLDDDPKCAMADWGIAMAQWHQFADWPDAHATKVAQQALATAETLKASPREQAYIPALARFFRDSDKQEPLQRATLYSQAMSRIYEEHPQDIEAGAFYALSLLASEPETDATFANRRKAGQVLGIIES